MNQWIFYTPGGTPALSYAVRELEQRGVRFSDTPDGAVTHLLLSVPCREPIKHILEKLPPDITVIGGSLTQPELSGYRRIDLLENHTYLAKNAQITAYCALTVLFNHLPTTLAQCPILILGWGRIGKCLAKLLRDCGADITVAARKESDRAMLSALGYDTEDITVLDFGLRRYRVILNTVPAPVLGAEQLRHCRPDRLLIELASRPGMEAEDVVSALRLPGRLAPEASGKLIAKTVYELCKKEASP